MTVSPLLLLLGDIALRWSVPALFGFVLFWFYRRSMPPSLRNWLCRGSLVSLLAMPMLTFILPPVVSVSLMPVRSGEVLFTSIAKPPGAAPLRVRSDDQPIAQQPFPLFLVVAWFYCAISSLLVTRLLFGIRQLRRMLKESQPLDNRSSTTELRISPRLRSPAALALFRRRVILVPSGWPAWTHAEQSAVLTHEGAHLDRNDGLWQWLAQCVAAVFWFHPGIWWLRRELLVSAEECCDRAVLDTGFEADAYVRLLLSLQSGYGVAVLPALSMASATTLERRLQSVFSPPRRPPRWLQVLLCAALSMAVYAAALSAKDPGYQPEVLEKHLLRDKPLPSPAPHDHLLEHAKSRGLFAPSVMAGQ